jgi:hypothetical protein
MYKLHNFYKYIQLQQRVRQTMKSNQVELTFQSAVLSIGFIILKWHYFLHCKHFRIYCNQLFENLNSINVDVNINDLLFGDRHVNIEVIVLYLLIFNFRQQGVSMNTGSRVRLIITQLCLCYFFLSLSYLCLINI